ncbi:PAS domain S-box protein [Candidatus Saganbacteria bacterium]|nr:PAS domain S-box protein [Candidatus Saganbacteria bacterium]
MKKPAASFAARIALFYLVLGMLWVIVTDYLLENIFSDIRRLTIWQTYKGFAFLIISSIAIYLMINRERSIRELAEAELARSEELFRNLAEQSPNVIFINQNGKVVYTNKKAEELTGYSRREFYDPSFDFRRLIAPEYLNTINDNLKKHMRGDEVPPVEYALTTKAGARIDSVICTRLIDHKGNPAILGVVTDISARKQAEDQLKAINDAAIGRELKMMEREKEINGLLKELGRAPKYKS